MKIEYTNLVFNGITAFIDKTSFSREKPYNIEQFYTYLMQINVCFD